LEALHPLALLQSGNRAHDVVHHCVLGRGEAFQNVSLGGEIQDNVSASDVVAGYVEHIIPPVVDLVDGVLRGKAWLGAILRLP